MPLQLAAVLVSLSLFVANARASDVELIWRAPERSCPGREELVSGLSQRLQRTVSTSSDANVHVTAVVLQEPAGYVLSLRVDSKQGTERRSMRAVGCNELAQATVLMAALFITPAVHSDTVAPALPLTAARTDAAARAWYVRAQLVGDLGTFPVAALGPSIMVGLAIGDLRVELGGTHVFSQTLRIAGSDAPVGTMQLTTAAAAACYGLTRRPFLAPCLIGELGRLSAGGEALAERRDQALLWAMAGASARASVELLGWLRWQAEVAGGLPWDHAEFGVRELGSAHRVASLIARLSTGLEGVF